MCFWEHLKIHRGVLVTPLAFREGFLPEMVRVTQSVEQTRTVKTSPNPKTISTPLRYTVTKARWYPWDILVTFNSDAPHLPHLISKMLVRIKRFRKTVTTILPAGQQKRHRCKKQTFELWEKVRVGRFERIALKHVYYHM